MKGSELQCCPRSTPHSAKGTCVTVSPRCCPPAWLHLDEEVREGWLELWYQPEIETRTFALNRAEGLIRIRHPAWGVVLPAYFIPDYGDPIPDDPHTGRW